MEITIFASGSSGNCLLLKDQNTALLIDAGISMRRIARGLSGAGLTPGELDGVLITHEHSDHISGLGSLVKKFSVPVYAPHTILNRLCGMLPELTDHVRCIPTGQSFSLKDLSVYAFRTPHDTDESVGYRVGGSGVFALATDMGHVTEDVFTGLSGADTVLVEANHDTDLLRDGRYPVYLKKRILSPRGHLSNADCAVLVRRLYDSGTRCFVLGHLSRENNTPALAAETVRRALEGCSFDLYCAPDSGSLSLTVRKADIC